MRTDFSTAPRGVKFIGLLSCFILLLSGCAGSGKTARKDGYNAGVYGQQYGLSQNRDSGADLNMSGAEDQLPEYGLLEIPDMPEMYTDELADMPEDGFDDSDTQIEVVEIPQLPSDDGIPLSVAEKIALHSTGELDRHLTPEETREVELYFKYYLHEQRDRFERYIGRSEAYLPYVRGVFREMGLPEEVAYLAIVESGFNSHAYSRAGAAGMWQFMPYTGKKFGLAQNSWVDERRDAFKATRAAGTYLLQLYEMFGDWHLAIAAYNAGEGKISRALQSTGASDFFELCRLNHNIPEYKKRLRTETKQYVPRLLAVTKIMRNLEILGLKTPDPAKGLQVTPIKLKPNTDLPALARNTGMSWEAFKEINPSFRRTVSSPSGYSTAYLDDHRVPRALAWLSKPESQRKYVASASSNTTGWQRYKVRKGDTLSSVSRRYGVSVATLKKANNIKGNTLMLGTTIRVPVRKGASSATAVAARDSRPAQASASKAAGSHVVRKGDTMYSVSRKYGVSVADIQSANSMSKKNTSLKVGQKLRIPGGKVAASASRSAKSVAKPAAKAKSNVYVVRKGDTLFSLAQKNNTNVNELMRINGLKRNKPIVPGQRIILPN